MNEQELIIQGNQASALMPELKRYIDEQIVALAERDKDTLFINFNEVPSSERQTILFLAEDDRSMQVYNDAYIPDDDKFPPESGLRSSIAWGIYDKYHESYPWLEADNVAKKVVDACIVLKPAHPELWRGTFNPQESPRVRLGYCIYNNEADIIEQHLRSIKRVITDIPEDNAPDILFTEPGFLTSSDIDIYDYATVPVGVNFCLKGWMLLKNS